MLQRIIPLVLALGGVGCGGAAAAACPTVSAETLGACDAACDGGDAEACARLGVAYERGGVGSTGPDLAAAQRDFGRACEHADDEQRWLCVLGPSIAGDREESAAALARLCESGSVLACHELARTTVVVASIPMDLPGAAIEEATPVAPMTITIQEDGSLMLDGAPTTLDALRTMTPGAGARAVIAADGRTTHGRVVEVIDALRAAGVTRYAISVAPGE